MLAITLCSITSCCAPTDRMLCAFFDTTDASRIARGGLVQTDTSSASVDALRRPSMQIRHAADRCHILQLWQPRAVYRPSACAWWMWSFGRVASETHSASVYSACNVRPRVLDDADRARILRARERFAWAMACSPDGDQLRSRKLSGCSFRKGIGLWG